MWVSEEQMQAQPHGLWIRGSYTESEHNRAQFCRESLAAMCRGQVDHGQAGWVAEPENPQLHMLSGLPSKGVASGQARLLLVAWYGCVSPLVLEIHLWTNTGLLKYFCLFSVNKWLFLQHPRLWIYLAKDRTLHFFHRCMWVPTLTLSAIIFLWKASVMEREVAFEMQ